ncbi:hypothetical protein UlMin_040858 [Ulmus minor]
MSSLFAKLEKDVEIKAPADKFHHMFRNIPHHISNAAGERIQGCDLHEGDFGTVGSVVIWNYNHDGKPEVAKEVIEAIDDEKNSMTFKLIEGDLLEKYKSFKVSYEATPKNDGEGCVVHWTLEYEKLHDEIVDLHTLVQFVVDLSKDIEAHLLQKA